MPHLLPRAGLAALVLLAAGCGGVRATHTRAAIPTTTTTTLPPSTTVDPFADAGQADVILAADLGSVTDFDRVATSAPLDPQSAQLARHTAGAELATERTSLTRLHQAGQIDTGALTVVSQHIGQFDGGEAVVDDCQRDTISVVDARTHHVVSPADDDLTMVNSLVDLEPVGRWLVTLTDTLHPGCG